MDKWMNKNRFLAFALIFFAIAFLVGFFLMDGMMEHLPTP